LSVDLASTIAETSMRLDADVITWRKKPGKGYQTRANNILRRRMLQESKHA
jgi:uncharacterized protein (DUF4415 family)